MKCNNCGAENAIGAKFCAKCGGPLPQQQAAPQQNINNQQQVSRQAVPQQNMNYQQQAPRQAAPQQGKYYQPQIPIEYKPIGMWGYFGYQLLFAIPCIGFIILLVFAFGGTSNINVKNFARSYFCMFIIVAVFILLMMTIGGGTAIFSNLGNM